MLLRDFYFYHRNSQKKVKPLIKCSALKLSFVQEKRLADMFPSQSLLGYELIAPVNHRLSLSPNIRGRHIVVSRDHRLPDEQRCAEKVVKEAARCDNWKYSRWCVCVLIRVIKKRKQKQPQNKT